MFRAVITSDAITSVENAIAVCTGGRFADVWEGWERAGEACV
jgi:hypothetical protein